MNFDYDIAVIGSGPAGQKAAVQGAKAGRRVVLIESDRYVGGHCVHRGTIPSKTLRENALRIAYLREHQELFSGRLCNDVAMSSLVTNLEAVIQSHDVYMQRQLDRNKILRRHGKASFVDAHTLFIRGPAGDEETISAEFIIIAAGSHPRQLDHVPVDHELIYDSDSILSMLYLPQSMIVLGGGVIASEYASIFLALGVDVTMIDRYARPLGFLDKDLTDKFIHYFETHGGRFIGEAEIRSIDSDGFSQVTVELSDGRQFIADKLLSAAGRIANVKGLNIEAAGLSVSERGVIEVDSQCRTSVPTIYAAGDVIGPPSLASASMEQGRRACCSALGIDLGDMSSLIPMGIYAIPEMSCVGLSELQVRDAHGAALVGYALFEELARGQISGIQDGMLKMIADPQGETILGVHIVGEGATELIHIAQMALLYEPSIDAFVENIFNFPTLAEAYRVAALQIVGQRPAKLNG